MRQSSVFGLAALQVYKVNKLASKIIEINCEHRSKLNILCRFYREGVPFTLSRITLNGKDQCFNYVLPYPSLESNIVNDYKGIVNAVDIFMDQNGILWILDTGFVNTLEETPQKDSEAKVLGIDSKIGKVGHKV